MARHHKNRNPQTLWIFCEGKTEERYFQNLKHIERKRRLNIKTKITQNKRSDLIIEEIIRFKTKEDFEEGDILSCLFDRDENTNAQLFTAKSKADENGIRIFFSNPCFEIWLLSHYEDCKYGERNEVCSIMKQKYFNSKTEEDLYEKTKDNLMHAIKRCEKMVENLKNKNIDILSIHSNPVSQVHKLIKLIQSFN